MLKKHLIILKKTKIETETTLFLTMLPYISLLAHFAFQHVDDVTTVAD